MLLILNEYGPELWYRTWMAMTDHVTDRGNWELPVNWNDWKVRIDQGTWS